MSRKSSQEVQTLQQYTHKQIEKPKLIQIQTNQSSLQFPIKKSHFAEEDYNNTSFNISEQYDQSPIGISTYLASECNEQNAPEYLKQSMPIAGFGSSIRQPFFKNALENNSCYITPNTKNSKIRQTIQEEQTAEEKEPDKLEKSPSFSWKKQKTLEKQKASEKIIQFKLSMEPCTLMCTTNTDKKLKKQISSEYMDYLQKYFLVNFNKLIPYHNPAVFAQTDILPDYLNSYFKYLVDTYNKQLIEFLEEETFQTQSKTPSSNLEYFKGMFFKGISKVNEQVKQYLFIREQHKIKLFKKLLYKQIQMNKVMTQGRKALEGLTNSKIQPNVYEDGKVEIKLKLVSTLEWLLNFDQAQNFLTKKISESEKVNEQHLRKVLKLFLKQKQAIYKRNVQQVEAIYKSLYVR